MAPSVNPSSVRAPKLCVRQWKQASIADSYTKDGGRGTRPPSTSLLACWSGFRGRGGTCRRGRRLRYGGLDRLPWRDLAVLHLEDEELRGGNVAVGLEGDVLGDPVVG